MRDAQTQNCELNKFLPDVSWPECFITAIGKETRIIPHSKELILVLSCRRTGCVHYIVTMRAGFN